MAPSAVHHGPLSSSDALISKAKRQTPQALCHVGLGKIPEHYHPMIDWYCAVLNAHITHQDNVLAFLRYDAEHHRSAIVKRDNLASKPKGVMCHYLSLKADKMLPLLMVAHGPTTRMHHRDQDGNKVELHVDNFDDPFEACARLKSHGLR
ncbi:hypothetical protein EDD37DRAFT_670018 [Exophiala viscosa]|uniref:uncharacterized protein n=1 Tax=Exophiala viscosa TaxID=2486360 RepID=UPI00219EDFE0|nr:hypothetical protein EDD37DRAFT_670018 [Exophiala viscosa]